jgi:hypothetical protein
MTWFEDVFGFPESSRFEQNRSRFQLLTDSDGCITLFSKDGRTFHVGQFETPSLEELRSRLRQYHKRHQLSFEHIQDSTQNLMEQPENQGAVFQVASQFNALEMLSPQYTPELGVTIYERDPTQGPAAAMLCPAALVYRNYFWNGTGQTQDNQLNLLRDIEVLVDNDEHKYWAMQNGYALATKNLAQLNLTRSLQHQVEQNLRVAIHWDSETNTQTKHSVCQVFCSACPIGYSKIPVEIWEPFARCILNALFEATLIAGALLARQRNQRVNVFLIGVGAGVFRNPKSWIVDALREALDRHRYEPIDVRFIHWGSVDPTLRDGLPNIIV